VRQKLWT